MTHQLIIFDYESTDRVPATKYFNGFDIVREKTFSVVVKGNHYNPDHVNHEKAAYDALMQLGNNANDEYFRILRTNYIPVDMVL